MKSNQTYSKCRKKKKKSRVMEGWGLDIYLSEDLQWIWGSPHRFLIIALTLLCNIVVLAIWALISYVLWNYELLLLISGKWRKSNFL